MGAAHLNGTTERHGRDACEGCSTRDTRIAELEAQLEDRENRLRGVNRLSRSS